MRARLEGVPDDASDLSAEGGLFKRILRAGDAKYGTPPDGAEVSMHYVGTLLLDGRKFDSSHDRGGCSKFKIGARSVILGWDIGVSTMHRGEVSELYCRADYAYGPDGIPPVIPPNAALKFELEVLTWATPGDERAKLAAAEKLAKARDLKAKGGGSCVQGEPPFGEPLILFSVRSETRRWTYP